MTHHALTPSDGFSSTRRVAYEEESIPLFRPRLSDPDPDMALSVYIETSVVSYLTARSSRNLATRLRQKVTNEWWNDHRQDFDPFCSQVVLNEASAGDPQAAKRRLDALQGIPLLDLTPEVLRLAQRLLKKRFLPVDAADDATHIALATVHGMDFLLTWNLTHIANAEIRRSIAQFCSQLGLQPPTVCTPEELLGR